MFVQNEIIFNKYLRIEIWLRCVATINLLANYLKSKNNYYKKKKYIIKYNNHCDTNNNTKKKKWFVHSNNYSNIIVPSLSTTLWAESVRTHCLRSFWNVCRLLAKRLASFLRWSLRNFHLETRSLLHLYTVKQKKKTIVIKNLSL